MASRMDKYNKEENNSTTSSQHQSQSRLTKNEKLYEDLYTNKVYTEFNNSNFDNVIELDNINNNDSNTIMKREQFQKSKSLIPEEELSKTNYNIDLLNNNVNNEEINYNINDVLENAKKNRNEQDEIEKKRRIKSVEYSILSDLSQEKIKEYQEKKQKKLTKAEEENLEELIHTITSNSLRKKIDDELLSDLLPTEESETIVSKELFDKIEEIEQRTMEIKTQMEEDNKMDNSFYTKSMDLSNEDFELEEDYSFIEEKKGGIISKVLIISLILIVICIIVYIICNFI